MKPEEVFFLGNGRVAFEHAWIVLKMTMEESRQTELGEYHPDFPSSHGPVKWYHGTTVEPASRIKIEGLKPRKPWFPKGTPVDEERHAKGVYASDEMETAELFGRWRGNDRNQQERVFGIREGVPEQPPPLKEDQTRVRFENPIPRQYITPVPLSNNSNV